MKKVLIVISFLISMVITIAHDAIHHHHNTTENTEFLSGSHHSDHGTTDNDDHHNHFPLHQHVISEGDLLFGRNTVSFNKVITDNLEYGVSTHAELDFYTYFSGFIPVTKKPLSSFPFIIPINSTRGSPSIS